MSHWLVYWVLMLDSIHVFVGISAFVLFMLNMAGAGMIIVGHINDEPVAWKGGKTVLKIFSIPFLFFLMSSVFLPNTKQMAAIYLIPKIVANKDIKQLPPKLSKLALEYVNKELNMEEEK